MMNFADRFWHHVDVGLATFVGVSWWLGFQILFLLYDIVLGLGIVILWPLALLGYLRGRRMTPEVASEQSKQTERRCVILPTRCCVALRQAYRDVTGYRAGIEVPLSHVVDRAWNRDGYGYDGTCNEAEKVFRLDAGYAVSRAPTGHLLVRELPEEEQRDDVA